MRGDRPQRRRFGDTYVEFTPHARGSTLQIPQHLLGFFVYPACAGIDPQGKNIIILVYSLPRMRGDRPCQP